MSRSPGKFGDLALNVQFLLASRLGTKNCAQCTLLLAAGVWLGFLLGRAPGGPASGPGNMARKRLSPLRARSGGLLRPRNNGAQAPFSSWAALPGGACSGPGNSGAQAPKKSRPISRVLSWTVIPLAYASPRSSSDLPGSPCGPHVAALSRSLPYLVLLQVGFAVPLVLPPARCALTAPFHPYRRRLRGT